MKQDKLDEMINKLVSAISECGGEVNIEHEIEVLRFLQEEFQEQLQSTCLGILLADNLTGQLSTPSDLVQQAFFRGLSSYCHFMIDNGVNVEQIESEAKG